MNYAGHFMWVTLITRDRHPLNAGALLSYINMAISQ